MNWYRVCEVLQLVALVALCALLAAINFADAQTLRHGQPLPSGPPRYYLREGSPQWICAPYLKAGETKPSWSCVDIPTAIARLLQEPPDCGAQ